MKTAALILFISMITSTQGFKEEIECHRRLFDTSYSYEGGRRLSEADRNHIFLVGQKGKKAMIVEYSSQGRRVCWPPIPAEEDGFQELDAIVDGVYLTGSFRRPHYRHNRVSVVRRVSKEARPYYREANCEAAQSGEQRNTLLLLLANYIYRESVSLIYFVDYGIRSGGSLNIKELDQVYLALKYCSEKVPAFNKLVTDEMVRGNRIKSGHKDFREFLKHVDQRLDKLEEVNVEYLQVPGSRCMASCGRR
jgi:hypothetical protein